MSKEWSATCPYADVSNDVDSHELLALNDRSTTSNPFQPHTKAKSLMLVQIKWSTADANIFSNHVVLMDHDMICLLKRS